MKDVADSNSPLTFRKPSYKRMAWPVCGADLIGVAFKDLQKPQMAPIINNLPNNPYFFAMSQ
jgi:hypothetical protein